MTLQVIQLQVRLSRDQRAKSDLFQSTLKPCSRECHKTQVWLCFFTLSLLTLCISGTRVSDTGDLQTCLSNLKEAIEKSDAMLYAPPVHKMIDRCKHMVLYCYLLELRVIFEEENTDFNKIQCIFHFNATLSPEENCPECETHPLKDSKNFFQTLLNILQSVMVNS